tara:strand:+ start:353 stop:535 length:183 start_codon:yes stop_codon:yes gene_type:complete
MVFELLEKQKGNRHCPFPRCERIWGKDLAILTKSVPPEKEEKKYLKALYRCKIKIILTLY